MIRLLLVDDSPLFCAQFRGLARWEEQSIAIQDEARNGKMAIECIERNPPDIILTDISMPVMDGIGLIEYVRARHPQIPVVALSAYDDFDYVRGSLRNGACDYILKHKLDVGQLTELIRGVVRKSTGNGGGRTGTGAGNKAGDGEESGDRTGAGTETGIGTETRAVTGDSSESRRAFFALVLSGWYTDPEEAALRMEKLRIAFPTDGCVPILMGIDPRKSGGEEFTEPMIQLLLECLNRRIWEYLPLKEDLMLLLIPGSRTGWTLDDVSDALSESLQAAAVTVERFFGVRLSFCAGKSCRELPELTAEAARLREQYDTMRSLGSTGFITAPSRYSEYVRKIIDYVRGHYSERISLKDISAAVGLSESYVSRIFKSETGVNIVTYINDFRLDEASRLLRQTQLPIKEIADRVGIENYNRFFNLFRERKGHTPRAYRDGKKR